MDVNQINVLILEDNQDDAELNYYQLTKTERKLNVSYATNKDEYLKLLNEKHFDIILTDYSLPQFNGLEALQLAKELTPDVPVIVVSGVVGEERAVYLMREGAVDFVLKDNLSRLPRVVNRALIEAVHIKEHRQAREQLITLSKAISQSPVSVVITDVKGDITYVNPKFEELTGYSAKEVIGHNPRILKSGEMSKDIYSILWQRITAGKTWNGELLNKKKDGSLFWENATISGIKNDDNECVGYIALKEDITWRKEIEQELVDIEKRYRNLFDLAPDPIIELSMSGRVISVNPAFDNLLGYAEDYNIEAHIDNQEFVTKRSSKKLQEKFKNVTNGKLEDPFELELITSQKELIAVEVNLRLIKHESKKSSVLAICRDITERKKAGDLILSAIIQAEDKERERISSEIHDGLQQTLICASLELQQLAMGSLSRNKVFNRGVDFLNKAINESRGIAHELLPKTVEDNGLIVSLEDMVARLTLMSKVDIAFSNSIDEDDINPHASLRLFSIVQEAINNSLKHARPTNIQIDLAAKKNKLLLTITDDGEGFNPDRLDDKASFGIHTMEQKAHSISGSFEISSEPGKGTTVVVEAPIST